MPRKKLIRRFEPRYGISRTMLELEATYVGREMEDYLLLSANDLQERLARLRQEWTQADHILEIAVDGLGEREKLAVQCLIVRDLYHLLELYLAHLRAMPAENGVAAVGATSPAPAKPPERRLLPVGEWLFEPAD